MSQSKTILITGTTTGIGRHAALHLAARGHRVFATGRNEALLAQLREESGGKLETIRLDVTDGASIAAAAAEVHRLTNGRGLDALVNNAGYGIAAPLVETPDAEVRGQFETNVFGTVAMIRAFVPAMMERRSGTIVNVSSVGGRFTFPYFGAYNGTKYAVESMSDALRRELLPFGVRVVIVEPGSIRSEFAARSMQSIPRHSSVDSRYAPAVALAEQIRAGFEDRAASPEVTSRAIATAIESRRPAARYVVPFSARVMLLLNALLPTRWVDALITRAFGLTRERLANASPVGIAGPVSARQS
jgi:NAD(P)-dependent dehydrogenase (short-subunit alcohol dehydrogenase family)